MPGNSCYVIAVVKGCLIQRQTSKKKYDQGRKFPALRYLFPETISSFLWVFQGHPISLHCSEQPQGK